MIKKECVQFSYNVETGEAIFSFNNKYGGFVGYAKVHPDDIDSASELTGGTIAEKRAEINYLNCRIKQIRLEIKEFAKFFDSLKQVQRDEISNKYIPYISELNTRLKEHETMRDKIENDLKHYIRIKDMVHKKIVEKGKND